MNFSLFAIRADPNINKHHISINKSCLMLIANQLLDIFSNSIKSYFIKSDEILIIIGHLFNIIIIKTQNLDIAQHTTE